MQVDFVNVVTQLGLLVDETNQTILDLNMNLGALLNITSKCAIGRDGERLTPTGTCVSVRGGMQLGPIRCSLRLWWIGIEINGIKV